MGLLSRSVATVAMLVNALINKDKSATRRLSWSCRDRISGVMWARHGWGDIPPPKGGDVPLTAHTPGVSGCRESMGRGRDQAKEQEL